MKQVALIGVLISTANAVGGCAGPAAYAPVQLADRRDPLAPPRTVAPWHPPAQMAVWVHPHEDRAQSALVGGHWIVLLLGEGSWYFEEPPPPDPVPDAEATREEKEAALRALGNFPADAVVPWRGEKAEKTR